MRVKITAEKPICTGYNEIGLSMWKINTRVTSVSSLVLLLGTQLSAQEIAKHRPNFGTVPLYFEENKGQTDAKARYLTRSATQVGFVLQDGLTLSVSGQPISMHIAGADPKAILVPENPIEGITNYYLGSRAIANLPHYSSVRAKSIRPGIDIVYHGNQRELEYDLVVHPGADVTALWLRFEGSRPVLADNGDIVLKTDKGELRQHKPRVWQEVNGHQTEVDCRYAIAKSGEVGFVLSNYDRSAEIIVDPIISYSTYLGGTNTDSPGGIAVDASGNAYVVGSTSSTDFPITSGTYRGNTDVFVTKLNPSGTGVVYSTLIGGSSLDIGRGIALDSSGNVYVTGYTSSTDFPVTVNQFTSGEHAFVLKLDSTGNIVYSTALAGNSTDDGFAIAADASGSAYVAGLTTSTNFPVTAGSYQTTPGGGGDAFVAKLSSTGQISYATYVGGSGLDYATAIAVDASGNAFVGGTTQSSNFPAKTGSYATAFAGAEDAFVVKLNPAGSALVYATYLGGSSNDNLYGLAVDANGNCYVTGRTRSVDFPVTPGAFSTNKSSGASNDSGFVTKLSANGTSLLYSSFLGGSSFDYCVGIAVDSTGFAYVAGSTASADFPTTAGALKTAPSLSCCDSDIVLVRVTADGSGLSYSTRLGSSTAEHASALAFDGTAHVYIIGGSQGGLLYPTTFGAYQTSNPKAQNSSGPPPVVSPSIVITKVDFNAPTLCNASISPPSQSLPGHGGSISFNLTLAPGCPWEAVISGSLTINAPTHGVISASPTLITGTVSTNPNGFGVTESVRIGAATFTVNQDAGSCQDPVITPASVTFAAAGDSTFISLMLPSCPWTAVPGAPWLEVFQNPNGVGPAGIGIRAAGNNFSQRTTTLAIATKSITVTQLGSTCTATASISTSGTSAQGGDGFVAITPNSSACVWTAYSFVPWIKLTNTSGHGAGFAPFIFAPNPTAAPRAGQILIADVTLSFTQDAGPAGTISSYSTSTFAGGGSSSTPNRGDGGPALGAYLDFPNGLAFDPLTGNLYINDGNFLIRVVTPDGNINTFAGGGSETGENIPATSARLSTIQSLAVDSSSAVYVDDSGSRVRKISQGNIVTFAGTSSSGFSGDNGPATNAQLNGPLGIAADSAGNVYISDTRNNRVRKVSAGIITTLAGGGNNGLGDNGPATSASLNVPFGIALDAAGNLLIADESNGRVRKLTQGVITTVAGGGSGGDGGPATSASLSPGPGNVAVDPLGDIFITQEGNQDLIRKISTDRTISTILQTAGTLSVGNALVADPSGNLYFTEDFDGLVKKLTPLPFFCTYSVSLPPQIPAAGGSLPISVATTAGCRWSALALPPWLSPLNGNARVGNDTITFIVSPNSGSARTATIIVAGNFIDVTQASVPSLSVSHSSLNFASSNGITTGPQTIAINFPGSGGVAWTATSNRPNIVVLQGSGSGNGSFQVSASNGPSGIVTVTAPSAIGSPKQIQVNISNPPLSNPFGSFDTPADNTAGVAGALPVTGWALDTVEVLKVDIWREPVGSEPAGALIFIGDAVFVEGARPDVESLNPNVPFNYRAGWGYQMLTNFLPQGNGTFKLHAIAHNKAGSSTDLGTKTIAVDNAHSIKPFGTIDTPAQGGTASGNAFVNFGWALTQNPNKIPIDGSTISVVIDGQVVGHPVYNNFRSDIATLFPGYTNSAGAVGFLSIDTTFLANGIHAISWNVFDNANNGAGIGSRYFTVFNNGSTSAQPEEPLVTENKRNRAATVRERIPAAVEIEELSLLQIPFDAISGYQLVNGEHRSLPIGSSLKRGVFYWQPGPGFLGPFHLVFERNDGTESHVRVTIKPKTFLR